MRINPMSHTFELGKLWHASSSSMGPLEPWHHKDYTAGPSRFSGFHVPSSQGVQRYAVFISSRAVFVSKDTGVVSVIDAGSTIGDLNDLPIGVGVLGFDSLGFEPLNAEPNPEEKVFIVHPPDSYASAMVVTR